jgi:hypothetical protein
MLRSELFCSSIENRLHDLGPTEAFKEARLKIAQCRNALANLQSFFNEDELTIANGKVRADTRFLIMGMMWVAYHARDAMDFKTFRMVVLVESAFTFLLITYAEEKE